MDTCPHCDFELPDTADMYCSECGREIVVEAEMVRIPKTPQETLEPSVATDTNPYHPSAVADRIESTGATQPGFARFLRNLGLVVLAWFLPTLITWFFLDHLVNANQLNRLGADPLFMLFKLIAAPFVTMAIWIVACDFSESPILPRRLTTIAKFFIWMGVVTFLVWGLSPQVALITSRSTMLVILAWFVYRVVEQIARRVKHQEEAPSEAHFDDG